MSDAAKYPPEVYAALDSLTPRLRAAVEEQLAAFLTLYDGLSGDGQREFLLGYVTVALITTSQNITRDLQLAWRV